MNPSDTSPQTIANDAADRYIAALAATIPFDTAPGGVDLIAACIEVQDAIRRQARIDFPTREPDPEDAALRAGYLVGIAIGRRIGGVR